MTSKDIPLNVPPEVTIIKDFRFIVNKKGKNLAIDLNGSYGNKRVISSVNQTNWKKTRTLLREALMDKGIDDKDILLILDILDNNSDIILENIGADNDKDNGNGSSSSTSKSELYQNNEMSKAWVIAEIARMKITNKDITIEQWQAGLLDRHKVMKKLADQYFPNAWPALEFTPVSI